MPADNPLGIGAILLGTILTGNILLCKFLGMCSFIALSRNVRTASGMGLAVTFVTFITAMINYGLYHGVLVADAPLCAADLTYLTFLVFIMTIAGFVHLVEMVVERFSPVLYQHFGIYLPLITVNCAVLGVSLFMIDETAKLSFARAALYGLGSGLGFWLAIILMAGLRRRVEEADVPVPLRGLGVALVITGLMALAFMGFAGVTGP